MDLIAEKETYVKSIKESRDKIATLKSEKITERSDAWADATGVADQKKDYVRSVVADKDEEILKEEANIEYCYNMIDIINDKVMLDE